MLASPADASFFFFFQTESLDNTTHHDVKAAVKAVQIILSFLREHPGDPYRLERAQRARDVVKAVHDAIMIAAQANPSDAAQLNADVASTLGVIADSLYGAISG